MNASGRLVRIYLIFGIVCSIILSGLNLSFAISESNVGVKFVAFGTSQDLFRAGLIAREVGPVTRESLELVEPSELSGKVWGVVLSLIYSNKEYSNSIEKSDFSTAFVRKILMEVFTPLAFILLYFGFASYKDNKILLSVWFCAAGSFMSIIYFLFALIEKIGADRIFFANTYEYLSPLILYPDYQSNTERAYLYAFFVIVFSTIVGTQLTSPKDNPLKKL